MLSAGLLTILCYCVQKTGAASCHIPLRTIKSSASLLFTVLRKNNFGPLQLTLGFRDYLKWRKSKESPEVGTSSSQHHILYIRVTPDTKKMVHSSNKWQIRYNLWSVLWSCEWSPLIKAHTECEKALLTSFVAGFKLYCFQKKHFIGPVVSCENIPPLKLRAL